MPEQTATAAGLGRALMRSSASACLATLRPDGGPFASYVITALAVDGSPLLLLSRLAVHTRHLQRDPRASLLYVREPEPGAASMTASRLTLTGRALPDETSETRRLFLTRHPEAARYADFADFSFYRVEVEAGHLVAGFGRIVELTSRELLAGDAAC